MSSQTIKPLNKISYRHYHKKLDEFFIVLEGILKIEIKDNTQVFLTAGDFIKVPAGTAPKTCSAVRTVNLLFEIDIDDTFLLIKS